jgi:hypothetical protein
MDFVADLHFKGTAYSHLKAAARISELNGVLIKRAVIRKFGAI